MTFVCKIVEKYVSDPEFQEFLNREFNKVAVGATIEELAEFTFGSIDDAIDIFEKQKTR